MTQAKLFDQPFHALPAFVPGDRLRLQHGQDVFFYRQFAKDRRFLGEITDAIVPGPKVHRDRSDVSSVEVDTTGIWRSETHNHVKRCGLPGSVRSQKPDYLSLRNV